MLPSLQIPKISFNLFEKAISSISPKWGIERAKFKMGMSAITNTGVGGFVTPGSPKRSMRGWQTTANSVDRDTIPFLDKSRAGSRDLFMNTPIAVAALRKLNTSVIGSGIQLSCMVDRDKLGMEEDAASNWERNTEREFKLWAESTECDCRRTLNFYELQSLSFFSMLLSGDCFVMLPYLKRQGSIYDLRVKIIESDYISNPLGVIDTTTFAAGIETDDYGAPIAYHVRSLPPGLSIFTGTGDFSAFLGTWERILAFGPKSGRRNVLHLFECDRPGQRRGIALLTPIMEHLKQLTRYTESELMAAVITSFFTVFIEQNQGTTPFADSLVPLDKVTNINGTPTDLAVQQSPNPSDQYTYEMGNGNFVMLGPNEKASFANPNRPNSAFQNFHDAVVKEMGAAIEMPFEILMNHFGASYSASRGAFVEFWRRVKNYRMKMTRSFSQPVYEAWLEEAIIKGRVKAPGFFDDPAIRAAWCETEWSGPAQGQIDQFKETQAAQLRIQAKLSTYEKEYVALHGESWEKAVQRLGREQQVLIKNKLVPDPTVELSNPKEKGEVPVTTPSSPTNKDDTNANT